MYDFAVQFFPEGLEHVQLSFSFHAKVSLNKLVLIFIKSSKKDENYFQERPV
jgi:hypothetical protein